MLKDFLGDTPQTRIIDFLMQHAGRVYSVNDLARYTKLPKGVASSSLHGMEGDGLVVAVRGTGDEFSAYKLADTELVELLIASVLSHHD